MWSPLSLFVESPRYSPDHHTLYLALTDLSTGLSFPHRTDERVQKTRDLDNIPQTAFIDAKTPLDNAKPSRGVELIFNLHPKCYPQLWISFLF